MLWLDDLDREGTDHFPLFQLSDMLLKYQPPFGLDLGLLPNRVLGKELIDSGERCVVVNVWVPFEQIPKRRSEFRQPGFSLFLLFSLQAVCVL